MYLPAYNSTPLYDRTSLTALESDVQVVSEVWFTHPSYNSVEQFVCELPLTYFGSVESLDGVGIGR
ncbi:Transposase (plasmid) [Halomicrobium sp. LC1Hm]|nr:Transposase [Halomicrobium sp. LC1Hm]